MGGSSDAGAGGESRIKLGTRSALPVAAIVKSAPVHRRLIAPLPVYLPSRLVYSTNSLMTCFTES